MTISDTVTVQNECQLVVLLAEARIGAELKAAQDAGAMAKRNEPVSQYVQTSDIPTKATLPEIGIPRQRASEMKLLAEVGEPAIRAEVKLSQMRSSNLCGHPLCFHGGRRKASWMGWRDLREAPDHQVVWIDDPKWGVTIGLKRGGAWEVPSKSGGPASPTRWAALAEGGPPSPFLPTRPRCDAAHRQRIFGRFWKLKIW